MNEDRYDREFILNYASSITDDSGIKDTVKNSLEEKAALLEKELELANNEKLIAAQYGIELVECNQYLEKTVDKLTNENELYSRRIETLRQELYTIKHKLLYTLDDEDSNDNNDNDNDEITPSKNKDYDDNNYYDNIHFKNNHMEGGANLNQCQILLDMELKYKLMEEEYKAQIVKYESQLKQTELHLNNVKYMFEERCKLCEEFDEKNTSLEKDLQSYQGALIEIEELKDKNNDIIKENNILNGKVKILLGQNEELHQQVNAYIRLCNQSRERQIELEEAQQTLVSRMNESMQLYKQCSVQQQDQLSLDCNSKNTNDDSGILVDSIPPYSVGSELKQRSPQQLDLLNNETLANKIFENTKIICDSLGISIEGCPDKSEVVKFDDSLNDTSLNDDSLNDTPFNNTLNNVLGAIIKIRTAVTSNHESGKVVVREKNKKHYPLNYAEASSIATENKIHILSPTDPKNMKKLLKTLNYQVEELNKEIKSSRNSLATCRSEKNHLQQKYNHLLSKKDNLNVEVVCKNELYKFEIQLLKNKFSSLYQRHKFEINQVKKELYETNLQLHESVHQKLVLQNILEDIQLSKDIHTLHVSDHKLQSKEIHFSSISSITGSFSSKPHEFNSEL